MPSDLELSVPAFFQGRNRYSYAETDHVPSHWSVTFKLYKGTFDVILSLLFLPVIIIVAFVLLLINPWLNPGPLFYCQERLGRHRAPFTVYKFRTMTVDCEATRAAEDGVEHHRITALGRILRKLRIDELPNFINVLRGEMSVIGPRPDLRSHAERFLDEIPHYAFRYLVKPGITGLAQVEMGYAEGRDATSRKAHYDQLYVETSCGRLDVWIAFRTARVVLTGFGAK